MLRASLVLGLCMCVAALAAPAPAAPNPSPEWWKQAWANVRNTTECKIRLLAYEYGLQTLPDRQPLVDVFDGLSLEKTCNLPRPHPSPAQWPSYPLPDHAVFVDPVKGSDSNDGSEASPFKTVGKGVDASRAQPDVEAVVLRKGLHVMDATITLAQADSGLTLTGYPGEEAWVSGGIPLDLKWEAYNTSGANVYVADITGDSVRSITGLMTLDPHQRLTRARFPNAIPEDRSTVRNLGGANIVEWHAPAKLPAANQVFVNATATVNFSSSILWQYNAYASGYCDKPYDPNCPCGAWSDVKDGVWTSHSYWCSNVSAGGWSEMDRGNGYYNGPILPTGLTYNKTLLPNFAGYKNATGAILFSWRAQGWFNNMVEISSHDAEAGQFKWHKGGFQGGRGWQLNGSTGAISPNPPFFIENVFEELDAPDEWYFDETTRKLYLWYNGTGAPPADLQFVATNLKRLFEVKGKFGDPVTNVTIQGLGFRDTAYTYMDPWGVPSGGDWALHRGGSVFLERTENVVVRGNTWRRVDGNALFLSGFNRYAEIYENHFNYIGDNAMAAWGYTDEQDGTDGDQPRFTQVHHNLAHELGVFQLQSSMWFQGKSAQNNLTANVFFNGPRAGINFNDGFGGGTHVDKSLIFNMCRHSGDHGPINSWDRQLYWTDVRYGKDKPSFNPAPNEISETFIIANYGGSQGIDNDDGSSWYHIHDNFFYGEGLKQDYGGHDSWYHDNLNVVHHYDGQNCINTWPFQNGSGPCVEDESATTCSHSHIFEDNDCIVLYTEEYGHAGAYRSSSQNMPTLRNNRYYTPLGNASLQVGIDRPLAELQSYGYEVGSKATTIPSDETIIAMARKVLHIPDPALDGLEA